MSKLLLAVSGINEFAPLLNFGNTLAKAFELKTHFTTFLDNGLKIKQECEKQTEDLKIDGSEANIIATMQNIIANPENDISLIILPYQAINLNKKESIRKLFAACRKLRIPYLIMPANLQSEIWKPENIIFPVCLKEGEKEAAVWAGYWSRTFKCKLSLLFPEFKVKENQTRLWMILHFIQRLFEKSNVTYHPIKAGCKAKETIEKALEMTHNTHSLLVIPTTRFFSPEYYFTGVPEYGILKNRGNTPVLFVNPRYDLYVPCG